jgi:flagellar hook-basal body complex protein FliE
MNDIAINAVLEQMRAIAQVSAERPARVLDAPQEVDFSKLLEDSLGKVNALQQQANGLSNAFARGDDTVDLAQVMVAVQKASVSFEAVTQVRNKLLSAYQEIMNMQV